MFIDFHNSSLVTTAVTVIWSTKDGHHVAIMAPVIALYFKHMLNKASV